MSNPSTRAVPLVRTFMTQEMGDEDIAALSTGRDEEFRRIMDALARSLKASPGSLQHVVLYGSRGFGKSFMTRRVQIAVSKLGPAKGGLIYVLLPEEQHNLQRSPHAFLDAIAHNLRNLETAGDAAFEEGHFQWPQRDEGAKQWNEAGDRLEAAIDEALGKRKGLIVVVVENFDTLLATLFGTEEAEQRLRLWLDRPKNRLMLLATATGTVDIDYDRPLFKAFEPVRLTPWSGDDCIAYFNRLRDREGKRHLTPAQEAKGRAIADFIGGTPRLAQLLADVIDTQDALTVAETMSALADKLAEYYRRRIEDLPPLARGLLDALIRGGEPASQTELARRVGARGQSDIARVMSDLQRADVIRSRRSPDSRETLHSVTDRVFVHYYRLRQGSRVARTTPLATILEFLKSFYSRDEQRAQALAHLDAGRPAEADLFSSLALEGQEPVGGFYTAVFSRRLQSFLDGVPANDVPVLKELAARLESEPARAFEDCKEGGGGAATTAILKVVQAQAMVRLGSLERAETILSSTMRSAQDPFVLAVTATELWFFYAYTKDDYEKAAEVATMLYPAILGDDIPQGIKITILPAVIIALTRAQEYRKAYELADSTLKLAREASNKSIEGVALKHRVIIASIQKKFDHVIDITPEAIDFTRNAHDREGEAMLLAYRTRALSRRGDFEAALATADEAVSVADAAGSLESKRIALDEKVELLLSARRNKQAVRAALDGVEVSKEIGSRHDEARFLAALAQAQNNLERHELARSAAVSAITLAVAGGDLRTETIARLALLHSYIFSGNYEEAWDVICDIRGKGIPRAALPASVLATVVGTQVVKPEVVSWYAACLDEWDEVFTSESWSDPNLSPWAFVDNAYAAATMAGNLDELDKIIETHKDRLIASRVAVRFDAMDGAVIAKIGKREGRVAAYEAAAELLPRIADLMASLPPDSRDNSWLSNLMVGFATECRDTGLLRDVANLLVNDWSPQAEGTANLLRQLAAVDEAKEPETALARMDPDLAMVIRRLRKLPDVPTDKRKSGDAARKSRRRKAK